MTTGGDGLEQVLSARHQRVLEACTDGTITDGMGAASALASVPDPANVVSAYTRYAWRSWDSLGDEHATALTEDTPITLTEFDAALRAISIHASALRPGAFSAQPG